MPPIINHFFILGREEERKEQGRAENRKRELIKSE